MGCCWSLKIAPFRSGFHPYPIITVAAATANDASVVAIGD